MIILSREIAKLLPVNASVLDIGCGDGQITQSLGKARPDIQIKGLETVPRKNPRISVATFDGVTLPYPDNSFDIVLLVDVLHHANHPFALLSEAHRVAKQSLIIKDHTMDGFLAGPILAFMDNIGNARHEIPLPYHYWPEGTWRRAFRTLGCGVNLWKTDFGLYPSGLNFLARAEKKKNGSRFDEKKQANATWELAYGQFESQEQEIRKFEKRLRWAGAADWDKSERILELFCGHGSGLHALERLGFTQVEGLDRSESLLSEFKGRGKYTVGDCRNLPFPSGTVDTIIINGGLHHLDNLEEDLDQVFSEISRVLAEKGRVVITEPWLTPFLQLVHWSLDFPFLRLLSPRVDALRTMIRFEKKTYFNWLNQKQLVRTKLKKYFKTSKIHVRWGKMTFVGANRTELQDQKQIATTV